MSFITDEIGRQPEAWRKAAAAETAAGGLSRRGDRVAVVGCGTSWFIAEAYALLREQRGFGETDAYAASQFPHHRRYDRLIAISRSGTTTEIRDLLARQRGRCPTVALTASLAAPVAAAADHVIDLSFADERSIVQTLFATSALALLRASLGEAVDGLADAAEDVLAEPLPREWLTAEQITFLGRGWVHGIAREAALKMRETTQGWTEAYPSMEYRHGPVAIAAPGRVVWHFGPDSDRLREDVQPTGALFVNHADDPQVDLVRVQRLAAAVAQLKGLDPDRPRNLSRSVVLDS
jgi:fructoselysine-6-P-deglycase FrlB-like protein